eukprot:scaffold8261_cov81-Phaeocystis_antarctica.AAC.3
MATASKHIVTVARVSRSYRIAIVSYITRQASRLCSQLKDVHHILTSIDGPHDNVLVLKPPLCFSEADASRLVGALRVELRAMHCLDLSHATHTPT